MGAATRGWQVEASDAGDNVDVVDAPGSLVPVLLLTLTSGCCRADGVGESDDDGSDERCRCSTGRRWGLPRVGGSWRLRTQATMWM